MTKFKQKFILALPALATTITPVYAEESKDYGTIGSLSAFKSLIGDIDSTTAKSILSLINIGKNVGIIFLLGLFIICVYSLVVQSGKLGGTNLLGPQYNGHSKQEAYDGIKHAIIGLAVACSGGFIFTAIMEFLTGSF